MTTDFLSKKRWIYLVISGAFFLFTACSLLYAAFLNQAVSVWHGKSFYFLLSRAENVEAGAYDAKLNGGAGYRLEYEGETGIVLAVYLTETNAISVQTGLTSETELKKISIDRLYFKTRKEKKNAERYQSALSSLYGCMQVLEQEIFRLDNGATQQSSVRILNVLQRQFHYMEKEYSESYTQFAEVCQAAAASLKGLVSDTVYASDLRYLLCGLSADYIHLAREFCL